LLTVACRISQPAETAAEPAKEAEAAAEEPAEEAAEEEEEEEEEEELVDPKEKLEEGGFTAAAAAADAPAARCRPSHDAIAAEENDISRATSLMMYLAAGTDSARQRQRPDR
jgi:hypothetical protein